MPRRARARGCRPSPRACAPPTPTAMRSSRRCRLKRGSSTLSHGPTTSIRCTGPEWICTQPRLPTKTMIGSAASATRVEELRARRRRRPARAQPGPARRIAWARVTPKRRSSRKNSWVCSSASQAAWRPATSISASGRSGAGAARRREARGRGLGLGELRGDPREGRGVGLGGGVDLVDRGAGGVEELQAPPRAGAGLLVEGVAEAPSGAGRGGGRSRRRPGPWRPRRRAGRSGRASRGRRTRCG